MASESSARSPATNTSLLPRADLRQDLAFSFEGSYETEFTRDRLFVAEFTTAIQRWREQWHDATRESPVLQMTPVSDTEFLIEDTRGCAVERFFMAGEADAMLLLKLEKPARLPSGDSALIDALLQRKFIVRHEGFTVSVMARPSIGTTLRAVADQPDIAAV